MKRSRMVIPWGGVALAVLGLIATRGTGQTPMTEASQRR